MLAEDRVRTNTKVKARRGAAGLMGRLTSYARPSVKWGVDAAIGFRKTRGFPYELSQEYGAKAKPGKAMAIPINREAKALSGRGGGPRDYPRELVLVKTKDKALLFPAGKRGGTLSKPAYVLVKSIQPRLKFRENVTRSLPEISRQVVNATKKAV